LRSWHAGLWVRPPRFFGSARPLQVTLSFCAVGHQPVRGVVNPQGEPRTRLAASEIHRLRR
jgi:hypothetical protein